MDYETILHIGQRALVLVALLSAPALLSALIVGLLVSVAQAATQIQEQTVAAVPRIIAVYIALMAAALWMLSELSAFASSIFNYALGVEV